MEELSEFLKWRDNVLAAARELNKYILTTDFTKVASLL